MTVKDVMTTKVVSVGPETNIGEVAKIFFERRFHSVPVVENRKVVGIIAEDDFFSRGPKNIFLPSYIEFLKDFDLNKELTGEKREEMEKLINIKARDIMNSTCLTIMEDMKLSDLLHFFRESKYTALPVTDYAGELVGIVTVGDILGLLKA